MAATLPSTSGGPPRLRASYRVQMNARFTLRNLRAAVPYLERLGVSHAYCSPLLAARTGSMHGYDTTDPARLNPELGDMDDLRALAADLHGRGMGLLLDIVPNHMSASAENRYWMDVLARGEHSRWSHWFDVEWDAPGAERKVILPVLAEALDMVLERGELRAVRGTGAGAAQLEYLGNRFPLRADALPPRLQLAELEAEVLTGVDLRALLDAQHYRLAHWRDDAGNYRRFFDVNELVALRMEDERVFDETHGTILDWIALGLVDGLRVDHVDGLRDPLAYLRRLRTSADERAAGRGFEPGSFPIFVEKILGESEALRPEWPVQGTTGYEFLNDAEDLFVDPDGFAHVERGYRKLRRLRDGDDFAAAARAGKREALATGLRPDLERLVRAAGRDRELVESARDQSSAAARPSPADMTTALADLIGAVPVYRTYIDGNTIAAPVPADVHVMRAAATSATTDAGRLVASAIAEPRATAVADGGARDAHLDFVQRFQQLSGPAAARGIEDTALYTYVPLVSRNEVGGAPDRDLADAVQRFHARNAERARRWPASLTCTDTHDTKRGADVRARLDAVSERQAEWQRCVQRWRRLNARHCVSVDGRLAPDTNTEYLLYQTLVGLWPSPRPGRRVDDLPDAQWREAIRPRIQGYVLKAARESKRRTSWTAPNAAYETALASFVDALLEPSADAPFLQDLARFVALISAAAFWIGAARTLLHLTAPGTPDLYQGTELASSVLVDPDNRRPVDYDARNALLDDSTRRAPALDPADAGARLRLVATLLAARRSDADLFESGSYIPVESDGPRGGHIVAFTRTRGERGLIVAVARQLGGHAHAPCDPAWWGGTRLRFPSRVRESFARARWTNALTGERVTLEFTALGDVPIASVFSEVPLACLIGS